MFMIRLFMRWLPYSSTVYHYVCLFPVPAVHKQKNLMIWLQNQRHPSAFLLLELTGKIGKQQDHDNADDHMSSQHQPNVFRMVDLFKMAVKP